MGLDALGHDVPTDPSIHSVGGGSVTAKLIVKDHGYKAWVKMIDDLKKQDVHVKVGVVGPEAETTHEGSKLSNAALMAVHEYGTHDGHIPERAPIRKTVEEHKKEYVDMIGHLLSEVLDGKMKVDRAFGLVGAKAAADIKKKIVDGLQPPNAPSTIKRKLGAKGQRLQTRVVKAQTAVDRAQAKSQRIASGKFSLRNVVRSIKASTNHGRAVVRLLKATEALQSAISGVKPLIDSGRLLASVTWQVMTGKDEE